MNDIKNGGDRLSRVAIIFSLFKLYREIRKHRKVQLFVLLVFGFLSMLGEMVTVGSMLPFIAVIIEPDSLRSFPVLTEITARFGFEELSISILAAFLALVIIVATAIRLMATWIAVRVSYGIGSDLGSDVFRKTLYRPYSWHISHNSSHVLAGVEKANQIVTGVILPIAEGAIALLTAIGLATILFYIDAGMALSSVLILSAIYALLSLLVGKKIKRYSVTVAENSRERITALQEGLGGIRDILLDGLQQAYSRRFTSIDYNQKRAQAASRMALWTPRYVIECLGILVIIALAVYLTRAGDNVEFALPTLAALTFGAQKILPQIQSIYYSWASVVSHDKQLEDVLELLNFNEQELINSTDGFVENSTYTLSVHDDCPTKDTVNNISSSLEILGSNPRSAIIEFREVSFRYEGQLAPAVACVNLSINRGDRIGVVGKTGSGKSTLIDLIMALLSPTDGDILVDGTLLKGPTVKNWQQRIAHVPQSIYLADASIAENIAFGVPLQRIDMQRVMLVTRLAHLEDVVESLPQKYRTSVGERGVRLSGGQRQRIGLARALYKGAEILILDEATSALDDATERSIMSAVNDLDRNLTIIMIAHRISSLSGCDSIYQLVRGQVSFVGGFEDLLGNPPDKPEV